MVLCSSFPDIISKVAWVVEFYDAYDHLTKTEAARRLGQEWSLKRSS